MEIKRINKILKENLRTLKFYAVICMLFSVINVADAETVSQKEAKARAQQFFNQMYNEVTAPVKYVYNGKRLTTDRLFTPFYVYNSPRGGFVIISAENKTFPILGYSRKSSFDPDKLSEGEKGWLESYAKDIEMIRYDSRVPEEAVKSWENYGEYISEILEAKYEATDPKLSIEESEEILEEILDDDTYNESGKYSMFYTPAQWQDLIDNQLQTDGDVAVGYINWKNNLTPATIYGKAGDYYRIRLDRLNTWLLRIMPSEYLGDRMIAGLGRVSPIDDSVKEEEPFEYIESILAEHSALESQIRGVAEELEVTDPIVRGIGGGHYEVTLPEDGKVAFIYSLTGQQLGRQTYKGTNVININIEAQPTGFYFVQIYGESGKPYGIKIYR